MKFLMKIEFFLRLEKGLLELGRMREVSLARENCQFQKEVGGILYKLS